MQLTRCLYYSRPTVGTDYGEKLNIVTDAAARNGKQGITGFILLADNLFLQILEGPPRNIDTLLAKIERDPRHESMTILARTIASARLFGRWSMGFASHQERGEMIADSSVDMLRPAEIAPGDAELLLVSLSQAA